jgi:hypothetical protein
MDDIKLPQVRPSQARRQELQGLAGDLDTFLPTKLSKEGRKRQQKALEETKIRVVVLKASAVLEKLAEDYRFAAKRYAITRYIEDINYYENLISVPQSEAGRDLARQAVSQWLKDLFAFLWDLSAEMDDKTRTLVVKELYPEDEETRDWLDSLGAWMGQGKL